MALSKVIVVGQLLVQLPPQGDQGAGDPQAAVDVVGFYDCDTEFLLIRARLRDSFVGIEGFAKLDLAGELLLAVQFGADPSFVLSAGGFHPKYEGLPERVPEAARAAARQLRHRRRQDLERALLRGHAQLRAGRVQDEPRRRLRRRRHRGLARLRRAALPVAALLLPRRSRVPGQGQGVRRDARLGRRHGDARGPGPAGGSRGSSASRSCGGTRPSPSRRAGARSKPPTPARRRCSEALTAELTQPRQPHARGPGRRGEPGDVGAGARNRDARPPARPAGRSAKAPCPFDLTIDRLGTKRLAGGPTTVTVERVLVNDGRAAELRADHRIVRPRPVHGADRRGELTGKVVRAVPAAASSSAPPTRRPRRPRPRRESLVRDGAPRPRAEGRDHQVAARPARADDRSATTSLSTRRSSAPLLGRSGRPSSAASTSPTRRSSGEPPLVLVAPEAQEAASLIDRRRRRRRSRPSTPPLGGLRVVEAFEVLAMSTPARVPLPAVVPARPRRRAARHAGAAGRAVAGAGRRQARRRAHRWSRLRSTTTAIAGPGDVVGIDPAPSSA